MLMGHLVVWAWERCIPTPTLATWSRGEGWPRPLPTVTFGERPKPCLGRTVELAKEV